MKRKNWSLFFIGMLAMCAIAGCSDNGLENNEPGIYPGHPEDAVYMNVNVQLPVGGKNTRSETNSGENNDYGTSTDGTEVGKDYENKVNGVLIVLADADNKFIAAGEHTSLPVVENGKVKTTQKINKSTLAAYYGNGTLGTGKEKINLYVFCNPTMELKAIFEKLPDYNAGSDNKWLDEIATLEEKPDGSATGAAVWGGKNHKAGFLMATASYKDIQKEIPKNFADWEDFTNEKKAFDFSGKNTLKGGDEISNTGNIRVERVVARFDFKDGSPTNNQTYVIAEKEQKPTLEVKLTKMAMVNMSKHFYYLRRVSDTGMPQNIKICGTEYDSGTNWNFVVDTDADKKSETTINASYPFDDYFNFCLGHQANNTWSIDETARGQWYTSTIKSILNNEEDNEDFKKTGYHIWRYATENTIPGIEKQENGISTGIVFKGKIQVVTGNAPQDLQEAFNNVTGNSDADKILYAYSNQLYVSWTGVREAALDATANEEFKKAVFGTPTNTPTNDTYSNDKNSPDYLWNIWYNNKNHNDAAALSAFKKVATDKDHQFTLYQSSNDEDDGPGYYCYYFYWNRHNDNGNNGVMGPMEFAVVRNNVYKLSVTNIDRLGHPRLSENDPDPVDPGDPDEKGDIYLKLSVEVLPWVVRVNDIEF